MNRRKIVWFAIATLLIGLLVIALNPDYRAAARGLLSNRPSETPIWRSNVRYYPSIEP